MKVLIWIGCILLAGIVMAALTANGIILGGVPSALLFWGMCLLAGFLCTKWYSKKNAKSLSKKYRKEAKETGVRFCPECGGSVTLDKMFCPKCHHKMY